jgi:hypothetical protein
MNPLSEVNDLCSKARAYEAGGMHRVADAIDAQILRLAYPGVPSNGNIPPSFTVQKLDSDQLEEIDQQRLKNPQLQGHGNVEESAGGGGDEAYKEQYQPSKKQLVDQFHRELKQLLGQGEEARPGNMQDTDVQDDKESIFNQNANGSLPFAYVENDPQSLSNDPSTLKDRTMDSREQNYSPAQRKSPKSW